MDGLKEDEHSWDLYSAACHSRNAERQTMETLGLDSNPWSKVDSGSTGYVGANESPYQKLTPNRNHVTWQTLNYFKHVLRILGNNNGANYKASSNYSSWISFP